MRFRGWLLVLFAFVALAIWLLVRTSPPYNRDDWPHWIDADGDCLNTRQEVLQSQSEIPVTIAGCRITSGSWSGIYSGRPPIQHPSDLDIDHVVPLRRAHEAGGWAWSGTRRRTFANDQRNLLAVHSDLNASKGSRGPDQWEPPNSDSHCLYGTIWDNVTTAYGIVLTHAERNAVVRMIGTC